MSGLYFYYYYYYKTYKACYPKEHTSKLAA